MPIATFSQFVRIAQKHQNLIIDLCAESDVISRSKLLNYLERHNIPPLEKNGLIENLRQAAILLEETEQNYTVNHVIVDVVNYYERRGKLANAKFLRDQILEITRLTDDLQQELFAAEKNKTTILDKVDELYRLVRNVREVGTDHYLACMRLFGDMKRTGDTKTVEQRMEELETVQRRHINPLRELVDPDSDYAHRIVVLRRRMADLNSQVELLAQSQELDSRRQRLNIDLQYIDFVLLHNFGKIADTARTILQSLIEEKNIKDAVAATLGNLPFTWQKLKHTTIIPLGRQASQSSTAEKIEAFFAAVLYHKLLPQPVPLSHPLVEKPVVDHILIKEDRVWQNIQSAGVIESWPTFVIKRFPVYSNSELLKAIALPLTIPHAQVKIKRLQHPFTYNFDTFTLTLLDFSLTWIQNNDLKPANPQPGDLSKASAGLPI